MDAFKGFSANPQKLVPLPTEFFSQVLPGITNIYALKIILFAFWHAAESEAQFPYLTLEMLDNELSHTLGENAQEQRQNLLQSLDISCQIGVLLKAELSAKTGPGTLYFINSPRGQKAVEAVQSGTFKLDHQQAFHPTRPQANVYTLYEENVGPLTPIIADTLSELENEYSIEWITEAFQEAAKSNVRNLRYIEAILKNWQEAGKHVRTNRRSSQKDSEEHDPERYVGGEFSEFIDH